MEISTVSEMFSIQKMSNEERERKIEIEKIEKSI